MNKVTTSIARIGIGSLWMGDTGDILILVSIPEPEGRKVLLSSLSNGHSHTIEGIDVVDYTNITSDEWRLITEDDIFIRVYEAHIETPKGGKD